MSTPLMAASDPTGCPNARFGRTVSCSGRKARRPGRCRLATAEAGSGRTPVPAQASRRLPLAPQVQGRVLLIAMVTQGLLRIAASRRGRARVARTHIAYQFAIHDRSHLRHAIDDGRRCLIGSLLRGVRLVRRSPFPRVRVHRVSSEGSQIRCRSTSL